MKWDSPGNFSNFTYSTVIKVKKNTDYILSFYMLSAGTGLQLNAQINLNSTFGTTLAAGQWSGTNNVVLRRTKTFNSGNNEDIYLRFYDQNFTGIIYLDAIQLEEGSAATEYQYTKLQVGRRLADYTDFTFLGLNTRKGINIPWLIFETGGETAHDGYGNGFDNTYFNGTNGNASLQNQLDVLANGGFKFLRLWINIYHYMNADKADVGYTAFRSGFLTNLNTYLDWCAERGIKVNICLDDSWYTFPWTWVNDSAKRATYIQACLDVVNSVKNKSALWGFDYCNEPYQGWTASTTHTHNSQSNNIGYNRDYLTAFFTELYTALKAAAPDKYFSVGDSKYTEYRDYNIGQCCDYLQYHHYSDNPRSLQQPADLFGKPIMIGEWGHNGSNYANNLRFNKRMITRMFGLGYPLHCLWSASQILERTGTATYKLKVGARAYDDFK